jgi:hypothetical protein
MDFNKPQKKNNDFKNEEVKNVKQNNHMESKEIHYFDDDDFEYFDYTIELPLFPDDFDVYVGDKKISDDKINDWIEECIILLESDKEETFATAQAGDTKLVVLRIFDDSENYHYLIEIFRNRYTIEIYPEEM